VDSVIRVEKEDRSQSHEVVGARGGWTWTDVLDEVRSLRRTIRLPELRSMDAVVIDKEK
jgi:hypothetical protein